MKEKSKGERLRGEGKKKKRCNLRREKNGESKEY